MNLRLRAFKCRTQCLPELKSDASLQEFIENENFWINISSSLVLDDTIHEKYPNYHCYKVQKVSDKQITPCKAYYVFEISRNIESNYDSFLFTCPTFICCKGQDELENGLILVDYRAQTNIQGYSELKDKFFHVFGKAGDKRIYIILYKKIRSDPLIYKDDVTGEYYAYQISDVWYLEKK